MLITILFACTQLYTYVCVHVYMHAYMCAVHVCVRVCVYGNPTVCMIFYTWMCAGMNHFFTKSFLVQTASFM